MIVNKRTAYLNRILAAIKETEYFQKYVSALYLAKEEDDNDSGFFFFFESKNDPGQEETKNFCVNIEYLTGIPEEEGIICSMTPYYLLTTPDSDCEGWEVIKVWPKN